MEKTQHISRRCYLTDSPPGTISENPTSGMISKLEDFDYTMDQSEEGYKNLLLLKCKIKSIESGYILLQKVIEEQSLILRIIKIAG